MPEHVLMFEIEIITDGGRRRRWSAADKLRIVEETLSVRRNGGKITGVRKSASGAVIMTLGRGRHHLSSAITKQLWSR